MNTMEFGRLLPDGTVQWFDVGEIVTIDGVARRVKSVTWEIADEDDADLDLVEGDSFYTVEFDDCEDIP